MNPTLILPSLATGLNGHFLLERLFFASVELAVLAFLANLFVRLLHVRSPRLLSFVLLIVLAKPVLTLTVGSPFLVLVLKPSPLAAMPSEKGIERPAVSELARAEFNPQAATAIPESAKPAVAAETALTPRVAWSWQEIILGSWLAGVAVFLGGYLVTRIQLFRIKRSASRPSAAVVVSYRQHAAQLGLRRLPALLVNDGLESPALVGLFKPAVLIPAWLAADANDPKFDWAIRHELTHWKWLDPLAIAIRDLVRILFYFHPAAWWAGKKLVEAIELACDRAMLRDSSEATVYAEQLFQMLVKIRERRRVPIAGGLFATRTQVGKRIAVLLDGSLLRVPQLTALSILGLMAFGVVAFSVGGATGKADAKPTDGQAALIVEIEKLGGKVEFDEKLPNKPVTRVKLELEDLELWTVSGGTQFSEATLAKLTAFPQLKELTALGPTITDEGLTHIKQLTRLEKLVLERTKITDAGLARLRDLSSLRILELGWTSIGDAGLEALKGLTSLQELGMDGTQLTDSGLGHLRHFPKLRRLALFNCPITDVGLAQLKDGGAQLEELFLGENRTTKTKITNAGLLHLQALTKLRKLSIWHSAVTDDGVATLGKMTGLEELQIPGTKVTDAGLAHLQALQQLNSLSLWRTAVTEAGLEQLTVLPNLRDLNIRTLRIGSQGLASLAKLPKLESLNLNLSNSSISDADLALVERLPGIVGLNLGGTKITDLGLEKLKTLQKLGFLNLLDTVVTDAGLAQLSGLRELKSLHLDRTKITDAGLHHLALLSKLETLSLVGTKVSDAGLVHLKNLHALATLALSDTKVTDVGLSHLAGLAHLHGLFLNGTQISDDGLSKLKKLDSLYFLVISGTRVTKGGLNQLKEFKNLHSVNADENLLTDELRTALKQVRPTLEIRTSPRRSTTEQVP